MSSLSYRFGYQLGIFMAQARHAMRHARKDHHCDVPEVDGRCSMEALTHTPSMVRRGVELNQWYVKNVTCLPHKRNRKRSKSQEKRGSLDPLI